MYGCGLRMKEVQNIRIKDELKKVKELNKDDIQSPLDFYFINK